MYSLDEPIAALATPFVPSALAVIRTSGRACIDLISPLFSVRPPLSQAAGSTLHHGFVRDPADGSLLDEAVAAVYRAPSGYTGEDAVELYCHGSLPGLDAVLALLRRSGFRQAEPGEFTYRAFMNGKLDLTRAEAVQEIVSAKTLQAHQMALHRLGGGVERRIEAVKKKLTRILAGVEVELDYAEDEAPPAGLPLDDLRTAAAEVDALLSSYGQGRLYRDGLRVALAGRTNAGKSSLFNLFLREDRAIVSDTHGTTRDYIEAWIDLDGVPAVLYDTAGIREVDDPVEREGIRRSREVIAGADVVVYLVDARLGLTPEDIAYLGAQERPERFITVFSKIDAGPPAAVGSDPDATERLGVSALSGEGFAGLQSAILARTGLLSTPPPAEVVLDSRRQKELLEACRDSLNALLSAPEKPLDVLAVDLREALDALGRITGEVYTEDILEVMFSSFCVGK